MELATASAPPTSCDKGRAIGLFKDDLSRRNCLHAGSQVTGIGWCVGSVELGARLTAAWAHELDHKLIHTNPWLARLLDARLWGVFLLGFGGGWKCKARGRDGWVGAWLWDAIALNLGDGGRSGSVGRAGLLGTWLWEVTALELGDGRRSESVGSAGLVGACLWGVVAWDLCRDRRRKILDDLALDDLPLVCGCPLTFIEDLAIVVCFVLGRGGAKAHRLIRQLGIQLFRQGEIGDCVCGNKELANSAHDCRGRGSDLPGLYSLRQSRHVER